ncbi:hypothetical protein GEMRC1_001995 [Eukaryota sp. GEM-RC1]
MQLDIDGLTVVFPYSHVYPEQLSYMFYLKKALERRGNATLEMPTGAGKTAALLSVTLAFHIQRKQSGEPVNKLIYCTRTVPEISQVMDELSRCITAYQQHHPSTSSLKCLALSSRRALCINPSVCNQTVQSDIDSKCFELTSPLIRGEDIEDIETCPFFIPFNEAKTHDVSPPSIPSDVFSLNKLREYGSQCSTCPYFLARNSLVSADIIVMSFLYLIDPKVSSVIESHKLVENSIIVFDEAHNLDDLCMEAYSVDLSLTILAHVTVSVIELTERLSNLKRQSEVVIEQEFQKAVERQAKVLGNICPTAVLPRELRIKAIPFSLRRAEMFLSLVRRLVDFFKNLLKSLTSDDVDNRLDIQYKLPSKFVLDLEDSLFLSKDQLQALPKLLSSFIHVLNIKDVGSFTSLSSLLSFCQLVSTYDEGMVVISEPSSITAGFIPVSSSIKSSARLRCVCLDPSLALKYIVGLNNSIVLTSATLTPLDFLPKILNIPVLITKSIPLSLPRSAALPLIVTRGDDQSQLSTRFSARNNSSVARNYALLIEKIIATTPDGVVVFFPSHSYMSSCVALWEALEMLQVFTKYKILNIERPQAADIIQNHISACYSGRGSLLFAVVRGRVSEGVDLSGPLARAVIVIGVPFRNVTDPSLKARLGYTSIKYSINQSDWLVWDAMRAAIQCVGRCIRSKRDYGLIVLADKRFSRSDRVDKLPLWLRNFCSAGNIGMSVDLAGSVASHFYREMAQGIDDAKFKGILLTKTEAVLMISDLVTQFCSTFESYSAMES